jgi:DNA-binding response OmpR family regulator
MLTAKIEESDKVLGLELGADDYVTKPFGMREIVARIRAVLRRTNKAAPPSEVLRGGDITLDKGGHTVKVGDQYVDLTPSEFDLLAVLLEAPGRVFSRLDLLEKLQGTAIEGVERTIDVHIMNLRKKLGENSQKPTYLETVRGVGYRFRQE